MCLLAIFVGPCSKADTPKFSFDGFANIGLTYSDSENILYRSSILNKGREGLSLLPDTWIGLQTSIVLSQRMDAVGQVIMQDRWDDNVSNYIELLFLRYQLDRNSYFKLGRFSTSSYLFTDSRYVSQSYAWVRAPIDQYSAVGAVGNMNGFQFGWIGDIGPGMLKGTISYGNNEFNNDRNEEFMLTYDNLIAAKLELSTLNWRGQIAHIEATIEELVFSGIDTVKELDELYPGPLQGFAQQIQSAMLADGKRVKYSSIGLQYAHNDLEFIAEYGKYDSSWAFASSTSFSYVSVLYGIGDQTFFLTLGETDRKHATSLFNLEEARSSLQPSLFEFLKQASAPLTESVRSNVFDQQSISLGVRWDTSINWSIKAQFDHYRINEFGSGFFTVPENAMATLNSFQTLNVLNISFSTTF